MNLTLLNNRYQIVKTLGRGGFGETFLAVDTHLPSSRKCVIKQLKPAVQSAEIPQWLKERFQREAAVLEQLGENHRQIPRLYAYFSENDNFYVVQELIEGITLTEKHHQSGNLSETEVREILINLLPVLDFIHSRRIIHRDVKPDNIILRESDGLPVLIDFGVIREAMATAISPDGKTAFSVALGTPGYMPSEQAAGRPVYSSDLYSLGLTAIFLLTGKTPQYLETDSQTGEILWRKDAPNLHSSLATVIDRSIRFHPRDRFSSAGEMLTALQTSMVMSTAATIAVSPGSKASRTPTPAKTQKTTPVRNSATDISNTYTTEPENKGSQWILWLLLAVISIMGGFVVGFKVFTPSLRSGSTPSPLPTLPSIEPQTFPTIETPQPRNTTPPSPVSRERPTPTPTPEIETSPTPVPEVTPTPEIETSPTPVPEVTPTPVIENSPTPVPEVTPTPVIENSPTPVPEVSPTPAPSPAVEPTPEPTANPIKITPPENQAEPLTNSGQPVN